MTPSALIIRALKKSGVNGVGQTPSSVDLADALDDLNDMFGQWQRRRWLVTDLAEVVFSSAGKQLYTVGSDVTNDIIMTRPDRLADAFIRFNPNTTTSVDSRLSIIESRQDYNEISLKGQQGTTAAVYYDPAFPIGRLYLWPTPVANGQTEIHLFFKSQEFLTLGLNDNINLPPEYNEAMLYNLASRLRPSYQLPPDPSMIALAKSSLATIRKTNAQIPELDMPADVAGQTLRGGPGNVGFAGLGTVGSGSGTFRVDISQLDGSDVLL